MGKTKDNIEDLRNRLKAISAPGVDGVAIEVVLATLDHITEDEEFGYPLNLDGFLDGIEARSRVQEVNGL